MKIRNGFVTNSSSSSAIISYNEDWTRQRVLDVLQHPWKFAGEYIKRADELHPLSEKDNPNEIPQWLPVKNVDKMNEELEGVKDYKERRKIIAKYDWPPKRNPEYEALPEKSKSNVEWLFLEECQSWVAYEAVDEKSVLIHTSMDNFDYLSFYTTLGLPIECIKCVDEEVSYFGPEGDEFDKFKIKTQKIEIEDPQDFEYFDVGTGKTEVWHGFH